LKDLSAKFVADTSTPFSEPLAKFERARNRYAEIIALLANNGSIYDLRAIYNRFDSSHLQTDRRNVRGSPRQQTFFSPLLFVGPLVPLPLSANEVERVQLVMLPASDRSRAQPKGINGHEFDLGGVANDVG